MTTWQIERLDRRGLGVAINQSGRASAAMTLPGEIIEGDAQDGRISAPRISVASKDRIKPLCQHFRSCGGCTLMHASDNFTAGWKRQLVESALSAQGLAVPVSLAHVSPPASRRRAVLSGRRTRKGALVGMHSRASDVIIDMQSCHVLHPKIVGALPAFRELVVAGASRSAELTITVNLGPAGLDVAVRGGKPMTPNLFDAFAALTEKADFARIDWDGETLTRRNPALLMGRAQVVPPPAGFLQATAEAEAAMLSLVREITAGAEKIADLFAGCGTFTLALSEAAEIHAVEGLAAPLAALDTAWRHTPGLHRISTEIRDLARRPLTADELAGFNAIVIDPPRAGAEAQAREIASSDVGKIAFVACDPFNFARDARILAAGGYALERVFVVDQFRWSHHVECVGEFQRY